MQSTGIERTQTNGTHTAVPVCEQEDVTVFWNQGVHTDREVMANGPDILIKNKKERASTLDRCGHTRGRECDTKESRRENNVQQFMYWDTTNVVYETYIHAGNNWSHRNSNKRFKEKYGSHTVKPFNRFIKRDSYIWNITHNTESTAV
jgi:hypothetical protein